MKTETHRIYVRWPPQAASNKTTTDDRVVAQLAYDRLVARTDLVGALGVAWTCNGKQLAYHELQAEAAPA